MEYTPIAQSIEQTAVYFKQKRWAQNGVNLTRGDIRVHPIHFKSIAP
jgi:hypothetical protein